MPITLTLKDIPDEVYQRLKTSAEINRRSVGSEAIACLDSVLISRRGNVQDRLARARAFRATLRGSFAPRDIDRFKRRR